MTPELLEQGARRAEAYLAAHPAASGNTESGGRSAAFSRLAIPGEVDTTHGRILYLEDVSVSFDGFKAINKLSLDIAPGELRCIIGPNGAGKTTMMDIITGKTRPDEGRVFFGSTIDLLRYKEAEIAQMGIGRKFQKPTVFEQLTVFENLELALKTNKAVTHSMLFKLDSTQSDRLAEVLHTIHLSDFALSQFAELRRLREADPITCKPLAWVFPNTRGTGPVGVKSFGKQLADRQRRSEERLKNRTKAVNALALQGGRWTAHDLRRTASTLMSQFGVSDDVINECLNHIKQGMSGIYIQDRRETEQARAFDALGAKLAAIASAGKPAQ